MTVYDLLCLRSAPHVRSWLFVWRSVALLLLRALLHAETVRVFVDLFINCVSMREKENVYVHINVYVHVCVCVYECMCALVCVSVSLCLCLFVCLYVCISLLTSQVTQELSFKSSLLKYIQMTITIISHQNVCRRLRAVSHYTP